MIRNKIKPAASDRTHTHTHSHTHTHTHTLTQTHNFEVLIEFNGLSL